MNLFRKLYEKIHNNPLTVIITAGIDLNELIDLEEENNPSFIILIMGI